MRKIAFALALVATCLSAVAQEPQGITVPSGFIWRDSERLTVRILRGDCPQPSMVTALRAMGALPLTEIQVARVTLDGRDLKACWGLASNLRVLIIDEDGTAGGIDINNFELIDDEPGPSKGI